MIPIRYQFSLYNRLLYRYLEHKYKNLGTASRKFHTLLSLADQLDSMKANMYTIFEEVGVANLSHLVVELYDLV